MQFFGSPNFSKQRTAGLKKSIRTLEWRVEEHKQKIINPKSFYPNWDNYNEREKNGFIKHWNKEIVNFENQINEAKEELKKRGE